MKLKVLIALLTLLLSSGVYYSLNDTPNEISANNSKETEIEVNTIEEVQNSLQSRVIPPLSMNSFITPLEDGTTKFENSKSNSPNIIATHYFNQSSSKDETDEGATDLEQPSIEEPTDEGATDLEQPSIEEPTDEGVTDSEQPSIEEPTDEGATDLEQPTVEEPTDEGVTDLEQPSIEEPTDEGVTDSNNSTPVINQEKIDNVIDLINEISPYITFDDDELLETIQKEYTSLSVEEKKLVTNYSELESAQIKMNDIKKEIANVYNLINMIPEEISIANLDEVENKVALAEAAYNSLPEESKKGIPSTTYSILQFSRETIERLKDSIEHADDAQVQAIQEKIEKLPVLTDADMSDYDTVKNADIAIKAVVDEYLNLPQELQHAVNNREKLDQAYDKITFLKAKIIEKEISSVDLSNVTESDRPKLKALEAAYNDLNRVGQLLVGNYSDLRMAISKLDMNN